jgi:sialate O-acetylesterase
MAPRRSRGGAAGRLARVWVLAASASAAAPASYPGTSAATLTLSASLGDYAVLQRDAVSPPAVVWGFGSPGATVTGALDGAPLPPASVGADGVWRVPLPPTPGDRPGAPGHNFTFASSDGGSAAMSWVAFGDVWACGGQSNAAFTVSQAFNASTEIPASAAFTPFLRIYTVASNASTVAAVDFHPPPQPWAPVSPANVGSFSAVCYFMGRDLARALNATPAGAVVLGLVSDNVGGTSIALWSTGAGLTACGNASYNPPFGPPYVNGSLFNGMIAPFGTGPTALTGWSWYQAEADAPPYGHAPLWYACAFERLIGDWRALTGNPALFFAFVQLAPFDGSDGWEDIRAAQVAGGTAAGGTAWATMVDRGDPTSPYGTYHPRDKQATGARLAAAVGDAVYGVPAQWRAPQVDPATVVFSQRASPGGAVTVTVTAPFVPGTVSPAGAAAVPAACPTAYGIPASACADFSVWFLPAPAPNWTYLGAGFLAAGNDVGGGNWTVQEAQAACDAVPSCVGFTWQGAGPTPPAPVPVLLKSALNFAADPAWQAWASNRDPRGERVAATGGVSPDGRTVTMTATGGAGQAAAAAGYGWATWPVTPVVDAGTGLPLIPWYAPAPAAAGIGA